MQTCLKAMLGIYSCIFLYIGVNVYLLVGQRGKLEAMLCGGELWKEMMRLIGVYSEMGPHICAKPMQDPLIKCRLAKPVGEATMSDVPMHSACNPTAAEPLLQSFRKDWLWGCKGHVAKIGQTGRS